mgnify:CR=1 FL=1
MTKAELYQKACMLPLLPGVYIIRDKSDTIIYIGKAKRLRIRVSQYFREGVPHDNKVSQMIAHAYAFDVIVCQSEFEALVLEASQIKAHTPKYNILLKDDKGYSYIKVTREAWPRLSFVLQKEEDDAEYIGPYTSSFAARQMAETALDAFLLPRCSKRFPQDIGKGRPCLNAHIGKCMAVCGGKITCEAYNEAVQGALRMIRYGKKDIVKQLKEKMQAASDRLDFETAALLRDQIAAIDRVAAGQKVVMDAGTEMDVIALAGTTRAVCAAVLRYRDGRLTDKREFVFHDTTDIEAVREEFLPQYYLDGETIPKTIAVDTLPPDAEALNQALNEARGSKVELYVPQRGDVAKLVTMAYTNAVERLGRESGRYTREENPLFSLLNPYDGGGAVVGSVAVADTATVAGYLRMDAVRELLPSDVRFEWGIKGEPQNNGRFSLYALKVSTPDGKAPLDGSVIVDARETYAERGAEAKVSMSMNSEGIQDWARLTGDNIGRCIAIVLDGYVYSAPVVRQKIEGGSSEISGNFTIQEAKDLANVLKSGKVPAPARIIQDTVVGPSLGQESINAGILSFVLAFVLVLLYMGLYYKTAGWLSDIALLCNVFLLLGVLVSFGAVLTLPGIAGIVLTMGMAVDANVIIYERIKEELRGGKGLSLAIKDGFSKAYSAIIDGNLTTIITGIVLFIFGNGPVQGFATTLIIGILTSLFCSIFITRLLIEGVVNKWGKISFSRKWSENFLNNTHFDFIRVRKVGYTIAVVLIALSCISFVARGLNLGAEFTGGRAYVIRFDKAVSAEEVRQNLGEAFSQHAGADASAISFEVKQYGNENQMRIVTQYKYDDTSDEATSEVDRILYDALHGLYGYPITFENFRNTQNDINGILTADKIGPSIAKDMTWGAIWSVLFSLIAIGLYISLRFKKWQYATGATTALAFNALVVIGVFSLCYGWLPFNLEVNQAFIAAILTIIGYTINDTVVVFDRIREYLVLYPKRDLRENVNNALNATLSRTINTSGTTLVTLLAILFFGGETIRGFIFALALGVVVGTLSTLFVATPIAYGLMKREGLGKK